VRRSGLTLTLDSARGQVAAGGCGGLYFGNVPLGFVQFAGLAGVAPEDPHLAGFAIRPLKPAAAHQINVCGCREIIDAISP